MPGGRDKGLERDRGGLGKGGLEFRVFCVESIWPEIWLEPTEKSLQFVAYFSSLYRRGNLFGN